MTHQNRKIFFVLFVTLAIFAVGLFGWHRVLVSHEGPQMAVILFGVIAALGAFIFGVLWQLGYAQAFPVVPESDRTLAVIWAAFGFAFCVLAAALVLGAHDSAEVFRFAFALAAIGGTCLVAVAAWFLTGELRPRPAPVPARR